MNSFSYSCVAGNDDDNDDDGDEGRSVSGDGVVVAAAS
jgi:hypothetical protein